MFKRPGFVELLRHKLNRTKQNVNNIEDVYDGEAYKEFESFLSSLYNITLMWNTDGIQIFNSSSYSLWPFYLIINELPPEKRFLSENLLIAGLWGSVSKTHPNVFLLPIYKNLQVMKEGVFKQVHGEEEEKEVKVKVLCGVCDAPATALFMNMKSHSGFYSCPVCLCRGSRPGDATVFPFEENFVLRNMEEYEQHKKLAVQIRVACTKNPRNEEKCYGIKGPTILSDIVGDIFQSMGIDSMHCIYLGVMRQMLTLWFDKDFKGKPFSVYSKLKLVCLRLLKLTPPHFLQRLPQSIEKLIYWKATELRSFLFNWSLPLLLDVLKPEYFDHFAMFVQGVSLLNSSSISQDDLLAASRLLTQFVQQFAHLYGIFHMSHNLHMILHLERCVRLLGPLWAVNCFKFEDINGRLTNFIHGTRHIGLQIHSNLSLITQLSLIVNSLNESNVKVYCKNLLNKRYRLKVMDQISSGTYCIGTFSSASDNESWIVDVLKCQHIITNISQVQVFLRLLKHSLLFVCALYKRGERVSSFVKYKQSGIFKYGNLQCFVKVTCFCQRICSCQPKYLAVIRPVIPSPFVTGSVTVTHLFKRNSLEHLDCDTVNISDVLTVMFKIECEGIVYLSEPLNKFELE